MENMEAFQKRKKGQEMDESLRKRIDGVKSKSNEVINSLYDGIANKLIHLESFLIPLHGIPHPELENPMNLFKR